MTRIEIIIGGFGGQGSMLAGAVLGKAAVYDRKNVVQTRSYGAEARGGAARSEVIISDEEIVYPLVIEADALIALSQLSFERYITKVKANSIVIIDEDMVKPKQVPYDTIKIIKIPATRIASQELKQPIVANMIMLGALTAITGIVTIESLVKSVEESVPKGTEKINIEALRKGQELAKDGR
ncbi:MAG: 2-oxoacid:acceptor oxidoreductase family protein [Candidatus Bathyarchaeia archaeon]